MGNLRVAVDVGGTFTDICVLDEEGGAIQVGKVPSTEDPIEAVVTGVVDAGVNLRDVAGFSHGTTYANPAHELRMREILEEELPGVTVSTSAEVLPEIFEHERFSTTVANAVLSPLISGYVSRLQDRLSSQGYEGDLLLLHSGGGVMTPKLAQQFAVRLAASGIAAGAIASRHIAPLCGYPNAIGVDMGGPPTDVSLGYAGPERVPKE